MNCHTNYYRAQCTQLVSILSQCVRWNETQSDNLHIFKGESQESTLGPLFFFFMLMITQTV